MTQALLVGVGAAALQGAPGRVLAASPESAPDLFFQPRLHPGQVLTDVFSRTVSVEGERMEPVVRRDSGTGTYTIVSNASNGDVRFSLAFKMDGLASGAGDGEFRDNGRTQCMLNKCSLSENASALVYDARFWGTPTGELKPGASWQVTLPEAWELGPPGRQTVTVLFTDPRNGVVMLKRVGDGEGSYQGERKEMDIQRSGKPYHVSVTPGATHWEGRTTFQRGLVVSDELLSEQTLTLSSPDVGSIRAKQREYMLQNLAP